MQTPKSYPAADVERLIKLQDVLLKAMARRITWWSAAEIIGVTDRKPGHTRRLLSLQPDHNPLTWPTVWSHICSRQPLRLVASKDSENGHCVPGLKLEHGIKARTAVVMLLPMVKGVAAG